MPRRAGLDRDLVLRTAAEIADRHGLEALTLATLAEALGVRTPSLYHYVAGLPGLRRELALRATRELTARMARAAIGKSGAGAVLAIAEAYRGYIKEHPGLYAATLRAAGPAEPPDDELRATAQGTVDVVLAALSAYPLAGDDALHAVRALRSAVHGFATLELAGGFGLPLSTDESFLRLVHILIDGLERAARG